MNNLNIKKFAQILSYYLWPLGLLVISVSFPSLWVFRNIGKAAFWLLTGNVFLKPLKVLLPIWPLSLLMTLRREIGIASFWAYFFHSLGMIYTFALNPLTLLSDPSSFLFFGSGAAIGMVALGATSNDIAVRLLKRNWKRLHRIVYVVFLLALYHSSLVEGNMIRFYLLGSTFIILKILEFRKIPLVW